MTELLADDTPTSPELSEPVVVAAIVYVDEASLPVALESVKRQAYDLAGITVVGGGAEAAEFAQKRDAAHTAGFDEYVTGLAGDADYVWIVHGDARPRPDAASALVREAERNEASLVGSKVLDAFAPDRLESVGAATDVFGEPYGGLDPDEVDLEQYDVVRDVAFVSAVSMLIRRDLLRGLGGIDPLLPPVSAGLDLSQRARVAGARVMVVPSAEVFHARRCREDVAGWREQAGRMRAMLKVYRPITLLWAIPFGWAVWLIDAIARVFLGRLRPMLDLLAATAWNVRWLFSSLGARGRVNRVRAAGDEELFRYQIGGSVRLRQLGTDLASRFGWLIDQEPGVVTEEEMEREGSAAVAIAGVLAAVTVALATRALWLASSPAVGFWLPSHPDAGSVLSSYAGGWNPAGLGSGESLHPAAAAVAAVQWILGGWSGAPNVIALISIVAGMLGIARLLNRFGVTSAGKYLGSAVYVVGPFVGLITEQAYWPGFVALGWLPWLVDAVMSSAAHGRRLWGKIGRIVLTAGLVGAFAPLGVLVPLVAVVAALPLMGTATVRPAALWWAIVAAVAGADVIATYLLGVPPSGLLGRVPEPEAWPSAIWLVALLAAAVLTLAFGPRTRATAAGWGGTMVAAALLAGIGTGLGGEVEVAALMLGSLGSAIVVGSAARIDLEMGSFAIGGQTLAAAAAVLVSVSVLLVVPQGRAGMPEDEWRDALAFAEELQGEAGGERILLVGPPESMPGDYRLGSGYAYRLLDVPGPTLDQAWLPTPRIGDRALEDAMTELERARSPRPGALLSEFAVRWVVVDDETPLAGSLAAQVDLAERSVEPGLVVFENLAFEPRAVAQDGSLWAVERIEATGPAGEGRLRMADNADPDWSPDWTQDDWANEVSTESGAVDYRTDRFRMWPALASVPVLLAAAALSFLGRERR